MPNTLLMDQTPINAIIGREPSWIIRSGIILLFIVFLFLFSVSWFIKYPDSIIAPVILTAEHPPVKIISKVDGRILSFFVKQDDWVTKGQPLVLLESTVSYAKLIKLQTALLMKDTVLTQKYFSALSISELSLDGLGELQPLVNKLLLDIKAIKLLGSPIELAEKQQNTVSLKKQYLFLIEQLQRKKNTWKDKLILEEELLASNNSLVEKGILTNNEIVKIKNSYFDKSLGLDDINIELSLYALEIEKLEQKLSSFILLRYKEKQELLANAINSYLSLASQIENWKQRYLLTAPIDGHVALLKFWSENQYVQMSDPIITITTEQSKLIGKVKTSHLGAGKIRPEQMVNIELSSYPAFEFGQIIGVVKSISTVPDDKGYMVDVTLPAELITTYGHKIPYSPDLIGNAKIITQKKRLLERFTEKIMFAFHTSVD